jgi:hypothetical protein
MHPKRKCRYLLALCSAILITGCGSTSSENVKSQGISASIVVNANNNTTTVDTTLTVGSPFGTNLVLGGADSLRATARGVTQTLTKSQSLILTSYTTTFNFNVPGTEVVVALDRPNDQSCPNSRVLMPDPFSITAPSPGQVFTSQDSIPVSWAPAGFVDVNFATTCTAANGSIFRSVTLTSANTGTMSVPVASVLPTESYNTAQACTCNVELSRTAYGTLDPNYGEGGTIKGVQARTVSITLQ